MSPFALHDGFKVVLRCLPACQAAKRPSCRCACGGTLHGINNLKLSASQSQALKAAAKASMQGRADTYNEAPPNGGFMRVVEFCDTEQLTMFAKPKEKDHAAS